MTAKKAAKAAATLGRTRTEKKAASARENGRKGGRPHYRYYRIEPSGEGAYGFLWEGTVLAIRPDGTGYLLTDRWEADSLGSTLYREYVGGRRRHWPAAAHLAVDATDAIAALGTIGSGARATVDEAIEYMGEETVTRRLIETVRENY